MKRYLNENVEKKLLVPILNEIKIPQLTKQDVFGRFPLQLQQVHLIIKIVTEIAVKSYTFTFV